MTDEIEIPDYITEEFVRNLDVHEILPQQDPFVMIDKLLHFEIYTATTQTLVREDNLFVNDGVFSASGMIENIAQTCAARNGFYNKYILHKYVPIGFIGAVNKYNVVREPAVGSLLTTKVDILEEVFGMTLAHATITCDGEEIATAEVKLALGQ